MNDKTCSLVISGILKDTFSGILLLAKSLSLSDSSGSISLCSFRICAIEEKYTFSFVAIASESVIILWLIFSSLGTYLGVVVLYC